MADNRLNKVVRPLDVQNSGVSQLLLMQVHHQLQCLPLLRGHDEPHFSFNAPAHQLKQSSLGGIDFFQPVASKTLEGQRLRNVEGTNKGVNVCLGGQPAPDLFQRRAVLDLQAQENA